MTLAELLEAAARGEHPAPDGRVEVVPSPSGLADAVVAFTAHTVVAADVDPAAVVAQLPANSLSAPLRPPLLGWLAGQLASEAGSVDVLLVAPREGTAEVELTEVADADHPRLRRAHRYRSEVRVCEPAGGGALVIVGRGLAGRYEVSIEVERARWERVWGVHSHGRLARSFPRTDRSSRRSRRETPRRCERSSPRGTALSARRSSS